MGLLAKGFYHWGKWAAFRPFTAIFLGILITAIGTIGMLNQRTTADPQELWVPPASRANVEQTYFAEKFGFFFRINTGWISALSPEHQNEDLFQKPYLNLVYYLQHAIENDKSTVNDMEFTLDDFCYKPISGEGCLAESPMQYFHMNLDELNDPAVDVKELAQCIPPPNATTRICFDRIGTPVLTFAVFGGISCEAGSEKPCEACLIDASGLQLTFLLNNNQYSLETAEEWERQVYIRNFKSFNYAMGNDYHIDMDGPMVGLEYNEELIANIKGVLAEYPDMIPVKADYLAERSIEDNIVLESAQNANIVVISYLLMFMYVSLAIGFFPNPVHTKFGLGAAGILVVIGALTSSIGLTYYFNAKLTMIGAEVVPFLILAIGVDNMFLISRAEREIPKAITSIDERMGFAMKEIGPSIFTAAFCEATAFFIGMLTDVPALQNFCLVAGLGVITDFLLQMTIFVGALALDNTRIKNKRGDCICCCRKYEHVEEPRQEIVRTLFQKHYVPLLFTKYFKILVVAIAGFLIVLGSMSCNKLVLGLNQNVSLVEGSDTFDYFETLFIYGDAGPPAYLVFKNVNYTNPENLDSMNLIASQLATLNDTVLAPVYSWTSAYQNFINPNGVWADVCGSKHASVLNFDEQMKLFVKIKIESPCCQAFGICGEQFSLDIIFDDYDRVEATRFRFQHQTMKTQEDYIRGLLETRRACDQFGDLLTPNDPQIEALVSWENSLEKEQTYSQQFLSFIGLDPMSFAGEQHEDEAPIAFTYSLYYVYYDQYTYIRGVLFQNVLVGVGAIAISMQVLSSLPLALLVSLCVFLVFFQLMGVMWMLNVVVGGYPAEMNAVLVVNLVTSLGFGVEFCNHIGMNFLRQRGTRQERAMKAMNEMGSSVVVGIASTKFLGVCVLAFAPSTLFKLYYFRMYLFIIILGVFNGLFFLPVMLSVIGPATDENEVAEKEHDKKIMRQIAEKQGIRKTSPLEAAGLAQ